MFKNLVVLMLSLPLLLSAVGSLAQSEEKGGEAKAEDATASSDENTKTNDKAPAKKNSDVLEIFIPSEKISEDLSVSFPVDI